MITGVGADHVAITEPLREIVPRVAPDASRIAIVFTHYGADEVMLGVEGAVLFLRATTFEGEVVLDRIVRPIGDVQRLVSSDYWLTAYYRACYGNCSMLDPATDICTAADVSIGDSGRFELIVNVKDGACIFQPRG